MNVLTVISSTAFATWHKEGIPLQSNCADAYLPWSLNHLCKRAACVLNLSCHDNIDLFLALDKYYNFSVSPALMAFIMGPRPGTPSRKLPSSGSLWSTPGFMSAETCGFHRPVSRDAPGRKRRCPGALGANLHAYRVLGPRKTVHY
jgi:hypothetical protein